MDGLPTAFGVKEKHNHPPKPTAPKQPPQQQQASAGPPPHQQQPQGSWGRAPQGGSIDYNSRGGGQQGGRGGRGGRGMRGGGQGFNGGGGRGGGRDGRGGGGGGGGGPNKRPRYDGPGNDGQPQVYFKPSFFSDPWAHLE